MTAKILQAIGEFKAEKRSLIVCLPNRGGGPISTAEMAGEVIRFDKFQPLPVFIWKTGEGYWRVNDPLSGAGLGVGGKTRKEAIFDAFKLWERLVAKRETLEALLPELAKLRTGWNEGKTLNPLFT